MFIKQLQKFEKWAAQIDKGDEIFDSIIQAAQFLKKRMKKKLGSHDDVRKFIKLI